MSHFKCLEDLVIDIDKRVRDSHVVSPLELEIYRVMRADFDLLMGDITGYLSNSSSDHHKEVTATLSRAGAMNAVALYQRISEILGPDGPSRSQDERQRQIDALSDERRKELESLFYDMDAEVSKAMWEYWQRNQP